MNSSPPDSSVHRILQARILEWITITASRGLPNPGIKPTPPTLAGVFFITEPPGKPFPLTLVYRIHSEYNDTGIKNNIDCNSGLESLEGGRETREKVQLLPPHTVLSDLIGEWIYFTDQARLEVRKVSFAFPLI